MIRFKLSELMGKHKLTIKDVYERTGLDRHTVSKLWSETTGKDKRPIKGIEFSTLEAFCKLFNCQAGDLLEYVPDNEAEEEVPQPKRKRA